MSDNLYLFANNNGEQAENLGSYRLYDMKIEGDTEGVESGVNYVDYLTGDGKSYIDTGIIGNNKYKYELIFRDDTINSYEDYFGVYRADAKANLCVQRRITENIFNVYYDKIYQWVAGNTLGDKMTIYIDANKMYKNGTLIQTMTEPTETISYGVSAYLFDRNPHDVYSDMKCYSFKTWNENNKLVQDLRPCLDPQGVPCMYDEVSKKYFYNKGTGTFGYKKILRDFQPVLDNNNVPCLLDKINSKFYYNKGTGDFAYGGVQTPKDGYTEIEYIESNGTQYIDTEVVPTTNTDIDMTCRACDYSDEVNISNSYIMNGLKIDSNKYNYNNTATESQPNLVASTGATLTMGSKNLAYLTDDEKEQAINNGWSLL